MPRPGGGPGGGPQARMMLTDERADLGASFSRLFSYAKRFVPAVVISALFSLGGSLLNMVGPSKLGDMADLIAEGITSEMNMEAIRGVAVVLIVLYGFGFVLNFVQGVVMTHVTQRLTQSLRSDISNKIDRLPLSYIDATPTGDILSRVTNDVDTIGQSLSQSIVSLISSIAMLVGTLVMMLILNIPMTVAGVLTAVVGAAFSTIIITKSQPYFSRQQSALGAIDAQVEEDFSGLDVLRVCNAEEMRVEAFEDLNANLYESAWKSMFLSGMMMPLMGFIGNLSYVVICIVGGILAMEGVIPFGTVVAFTLYIRMFSQPLSNIAQTFSSLQSMAAACERVFDFLDADEVGDESNKQKRLEGVSGAVMFDHVKFGYEKEKEIIHDFSTYTLPGQKVAIVGPTGAGKSTMVNLLMRFYDVDSGSIVIDGIDTQDVPRANLRDQFGMVLQDTWFFEGTLRENLTFGSVDITDERLDEVCEACGLLGWIRTLPAGYDTTFEDSSLSAGQRQLVTIARAMLKDAPLLILDEATSSVDTRTEMRVQEAMDELTADRTSFVIAHRLSTIRNADWILVMRDGDIVEQGTHDELLAAHGFYADLYNSQFAAEQAA